MSKSTLAEQATHEKVWVRTFDGKTEPKPTVVTVIAVKVRLARYDKFGSKRNANARVPKPTQTKNAVMAKTSRRCLSLTD